MSTIPNVVIDDYLQQIVNIDLSGHSYHLDITPDLTIIAAWSNYNSIVKDISSGNLAPHNAKIVALMIRLELLKKASTDLLQMTMENILMTICQVEKKIDDNVIKVGNND